MNPFNEVYLRCCELGNAAHILGPGHRHYMQDYDEKGVGHVMKDQTDDGHLVELRGPITLRALNFRLADMDGAEVNSQETTAADALAVAGVGTAWAMEGVSTAAARDYQDPL